MMKIKVYVSFSEEEVMTEVQFKAWMEDKAADMVSDEDELSSILESLNVSAAEIYMMDNEDLDNLRQKVKEQAEWGLYDDYGFHEYELEV